MEIITVGKSKRMHKEFPEHQHGYWEVLLNEEGSGQFFANGGSWLFSPGSIAVIPPDTPHSKKSAEGFSDRSVFIKNFREIGRKGVKVFQDAALGTVIKIFVMMDLFHEQDLQSVGDVAGVIVNVLGDLLYHVLASYYDQSRKKDLRLEGVVELMHDNVSNRDFDLTQAIASSGYSMGYFRKIFKEMTGQSPVAYFNVLRISHAKSLFQQYESSWSVKEVAYQSGFDDPLYFSRVFRKLEGVSPRQYVAMLAGEVTEEDIRLISMDTPEELI